MWKRKESLQSIQIYPSECRSRLSDCLSESTIPRFDIVREFGEIGEPMGLTPSLGAGGVRHNHSGHSRRNYFYIIETSSELLGLLPRRSTGAVALVISS